jgi:probable selenium-dependent hydroxylase accessory protein YqeC
MVKTYLAGSLREQLGLLQALGIEKLRNPVISVVGAGGKTTLITRMAEEYKNIGIPVIVTTTTHMMVEEQPWFLTTLSIEKVKAVINAQGMVWVGCPAHGGKMKAPPKEFLGQLFGLGFPVLIEADGARKLPIKVPAEHEPVISKETTHVINVYGLDALEKTFAEVCFRQEKAAHLLGKNIKDIITETDIAELAYDDRAGRKRVTASMSYQVVLNKADTLESEDAALRICRLAEKRRENGLIVMAEGKR